MGDVSVFLKMTMPSLAKYVNGLRHVYVVTQRDVLLEFANDHPNKRNIRGSDGHGIVVDGVRFIFVPESNFDYSKDDVGKGWIYQQYLKLSVFDGIPDILDTVLLVDSETVFLRPVTYAFRESEGTRLHLLYPVGNSADEGAECKGNSKRLYPVQSLMERNVPNANRTTNPVVHHMIYQRTVADALLRQMEETFGSPLPLQLKKLDYGLSEYLMMFTYSFHFHRPSMRIVDMPMNSATSRCGLNITEPKPEWDRPPVTQTCHSHMQKDPRDISVCIRCRSDEATASK